MELKAAAAAQHLGDGGGHGLDHALLIERVQELVRLLDRHHVQPAARHAHHEVTRAVMLEDGLYLLHGLCGGP